MCLHAALELVINLVLYSCLKFQLALSGPSLPACWRGRDSDGRPPGYQGDGGDDGFDEYEHGIQWSGARCGNDDDGACDFIARR